MLFSSLVKKKYGLIGIYHITLPILNTVNFRVLEALRDIKYANLPMLGHIYGRTIIFGQSFHVNTGI